MHYVLIFVAYYFYTFLKCQCLFFFAYKIESDESRGAFHIDSKLERQVLNLRIITNIL